MADSQSRCASPAFLLTNIMFGVVLYEDKPMKNKTHIGNVTLVLSGKSGDSGKFLLLGLKRPKKKSDNKRKRKKVGSGRWVPPGGGTEPSDKSQKHSARREVFEEMGLHFPLASFKRMGTLWGYEAPSKIPIWKVYLYVVEAKGLPSEIAPNEEYTAVKWFPIKKLPFDKMLTGDRKWIPRLIRGDKLSIRITFHDDEGKVSSCVIKDIKSFN
jgi:8-oxo-dGTP pyrophosphatase MutT (NUDIX family)